MYAYYPSKRILTCFFLLTFVFITPAAWASDHGNSIQRATSVGPNSTTAGRINPAGDNDFFRINVPSAGTLTVNTTGSTDTYGYLLGGSGNTLASNDDAGGALGRNFRISRPVSAGTYYVRVRHYSSGGTGAYNLVVAFSGTTPPPPPPPPSGGDHGNSIQRATPVGPNSTTAGRINPAGDNDFFRINVPSAGTLTVNTTGGTDTYGYLLDGNGRQLAENDDAGGALGRNFRISRSVSAGTYYVRVRHFSSRGTGAYTLVVAYNGAPQNAGLVEIPVSGMNDFILYRVDGPNELVSPAQLFAGVALRLSLDVISAYLSPTQEDYVTRRLQLNGTLPIFHLLCTQDDRGNVLPIIVIKPANQFWMNNLGLIQLNIAAVPVQSHLAQTGRDVIFGSFLPGYSAIKALFDRNPTPVSLTTTRRQGWSFLEARKIYVLLPKNSASWRFSDIATGSSTNYAGVISMKNQGLRGMAAINDSCVKYGDSRSTLSIVGAGR